jgi:hypothetical protein
VLFASPKRPNESKLNHGSSRRKWRRRFGALGKNSPLFEIARLLVRLDLL